MSEVCRSIRSGASGLPYYCAPLVCVSAVIDSLTVWRFNKPKPKPKMATQKEKDRQHDEDEGMVTERPRQKEKDI